MIITGQVIIFKKEDEHHIYIYMNNILLWKYWKCEPRGRVLYEHGGI